MPGTFVEQKSERALRPQGVTGGGAPFEEGVRAIHREEAEKAPEPVQPADKLKIDKKKLIIYSEILKPKFDA